MVFFCAEKGIEKERRERDRECPRVRLRPWATSADVSSRAAASVSNLTGNFFLLASKPQSQTLPPTSMSLSLPRHSTPSTLFSFIPLLWKTRDLRVNTYEQPHPEPLNYLPLKVAKYNDGKTCLTALF